MEIPLDFFDEKMLGVAVFLFGLIIGSFLNVVIFRLESGEKLTGRSHCAKCSHTLRFFELIPVFSFLFLRAQCAKCKEKISLQYPLVELITGLLFLGIYLTEGFTLQGFFMLVASALLISIFAFDFRHLIIPNELVYPFNALAFLALFFSSADLSVSLVVPSVFELLAGPLVAFPLWLLWRISSGRWIGFADSKLALGIGWFLGILGGFSAVMLAFWVGAVISLLILLLKRIHLAFSHTSLTIKSEVPFGPFLIIGFFLVYFFNINAFLLFAW